MEVDGEDLPPWDAKLISWKRLVKEKPTVEQYSREGGCVGDCDHCPLSHSFFPDTTECVLAFAGFTQPVLKEEIKGQQSAFDQALSWTDSRPAAEMDYLLED